MRILMLSQFYSPILGGAERHVQDLSRELMARGHSVAVATLWQPDLPEFEVDHGVRVYRLRGTVERMGWLFSNARRRYAPPFPDVETMLALRQVVERERPEIVHAHNWLARSFLPLKTWSGARLVVTLHDYNLRCAKGSFSYHGMECTGPGPAKCVGCAVQHYGLAKGLPTLLANWACGAVERHAVDMFVPVSHDLARASGLAGSQLPYRVVPNFIADAGAAIHAPDDASESDEACLAQLPDEEYLLFAGALNRSKGVDVLLRAYGDLRGGPPLVLIGFRSPDYQVPLTVPPPGRVVALYDWPHHLMMQAWRRCAVALVPSVAPETFGLVAAEAMACGKPVIASRLGGLPELIVDGETGLLVAPGDAEALRQAIERVLAYRRLGERMGAAARRRMEGFRASAVVPRIEQVYEDVLAAKTLPAIPRTGVRAPLPIR
jgi:glycosyltransferase involved in cell wall biosynthesis